MKNKDWIKRAKNLMAQQRLSQSDVVDAMKVKSTGAISHYFTGRNEPTIEQLNNLAKRLGVTPQYLIYGGDSSNDIDGSLLSKCSKVVRDLNQSQNLGLSEEQQVELVIYIYNQSQTEQGVAILSEKRIIDTAMLLSKTLAL